MCVKLFIVFHMPLIVYSVFFNLYLCALVWIFSLPLCSGLLLFCPICWRHQVLSTLLGNFAKKSKDIGTVIGPCANKERALLICFWIEHTSMFKEKIEPEREKEDDFWIKLFERGEKT